MNNFQQLQHDWEDEFPVPTELGSRVIREAETLSFFGKVVELFIPNALDTVVSFIGGGGSSSTDSEGSNRKSGGDPASGRAWMQGPSGKPGGDPFAR